VIRFRGIKSPLSNLFILKEGLVYKGLYFNCSEQAYQWEKCAFHRNKKLAERVLYEQDPYLQMKLGKTVKENTRWTEEKSSYMREILKFKLINCKEYRTSLKNSNACTIIEDTSNNFWGRGFEGKGQNQLGVLHCELRALSRICENQN